MASAINALRDLTSTSTTSSHKKDDDLPRPSTTWSAAPRKSRRSLKRVAFYAISAFALFYTVKTFSTGSVSPDSPFHEGNRVYEAPGGGLTYLGRPLPGTPVRGSGEPGPEGLGVGIQGIPGKGKTDKATQAGKGIIAAPMPDSSLPSLIKDYEGPFRFNNLALTILYIGRTGGGQPKNKNILFAAGSYRSAAKLIPMACAMADELNNYVHFAIVSKGEIPLQELREINGAAEGCKVIFHDARPNLASVSTTERMEGAAGRAFYHMNMYMHPQAVIVDASGDEGFFLNGFRSFASEHDIPLIELPESPAKKLAFITKLDSLALSQWHTPKVNIVIDASSRNVGGLIRLLKTLSEADFSGMSIPHLTIDLPHKIEGAAKQYLADFTWPPKHMGVGHGNMLTIRRRINSKAQDEVSHTVRFLESFWPTNPTNSHVLVLSPQVEVSRYFFHYLQYTMLYYHYSAQAIAQSWNKRMLGISLDYPSTFLNGTDNFVAPGNQVVSRHGDHTEESFLWQAPNSNAMLIFGPKWMEIHDLFSTLLALPEEISPNIPKQLSKAFPSWLEYVVLLARTRGYVTLYPSPTTAATISTTHDELYNAPEEYTTLDASETSRRRKEKEIKLSVGSQVTMLDTLFENELPSLADVGLLDWTGSKVKLQEFNEEVKVYAGAFKEVVGGCVGVIALTPKLRKDGEVGDLFCIV